MDRYLHYARPVRAENVSEGMRLIGPDFTKYIVDGVWPGLKGSIEIDLMAESETCNRMGLTPKRKRLHRSPNEIL